MRRLSALLVSLAMIWPLAGGAQDSDATTAYGVDSSASWLRVLAYPDGPLKRFGHHHVISHHDISGTVEVAADPLQSSFVLELDVADLAVDDPEMRALEGEEFEGEVPQKDIDGTRANMLGEKLLYADAHPGITIRSNGISGTMPDVTIEAVFTVKGSENTVTIPAHVEFTDESFVATGELELSHEALGLSQFTAMGGALSVRDLLVFKFQIAGRR